MFFTKSFRWVLTYNLALDPSDVRPSAGLQKSDTRDPRHTLRRWLHQEKKSRLVDHVYYKLDHEYTQANISHNALKNRDFACVQTLQDISSEFPVDIFPGHTGEKKGRHLDEDYDYYGLDEDEEDGYDGIYPFDRLGSSGTSYLTTSLVDLDGLQVMQHTGLDETKVLQEDGFDEADPAEEYQGYTGNEVRLVVRVPEYNNAD